MFGCDKFASGMYYVKEKYKDKLTGADIDGAFASDPFFDSWDEVRAISTTIYHASCLICVWSLRTTHKSKITTHESPRK